MIATLELSASRRKETKRMKPRSYEYHESVLLAETLKLLAPEPGEVMVDGTLGGGGHSAALLAAGLRVIGLDQDPAAITFARAKLAGAGEMFTAVRSNFTKIGDVLDRLGIATIDGALLDLGVSSHQIDAAERGFSFQSDGPLDMRMDPAAPVSAADLVNTMSGEQLERIFRQLGEESGARKIAAKIARERLVRPFKTTRELAETVEAVIPRHGRAHPATKVFQALRIAVNRELDALEEGLATITARLAPGGRIAVITFHSLEDRIVKTFFKHRAAEFIDRPEWPAPRRNPDYCFKLLNSKPIIASEAEQRANPRSRSAKLRGAQKIHAHGHQ
jgi:16S rRNA (cytosine1402-N4)-methyltransferase